MLYMIYVIWEQDDQAVKTPAFGPEGSRLDSRLKPLAQLSKAEFYTVTYKLMIFFSLFNQVPESISLVVPVSTKHFALSSLVVCRKHFILAFA